MTVEDDIITIDHWSHNSVEESTRHNWLAEDVETPMLQQGACLR